MANYSFKKFSVALYPLAILHSLQTDRETDGRTTTMTIA